MERDRHDEDPRPVTDAPSPVSRPRRRRRLWLALGAATLAGGLVTAWALLPAAGLRWGVVRTLRALGMVEVTLGDADLSLFDGHLVVSGMVARPELGPALGVGDVALSFRWRPLWNRRLAIERAALSGVEIELTRAKGADVFVLNGLPLALGGGGDAPGPDGTAPKGVMTAWGLEVGEMELTQSRLLVTDGDLRAEIDVDRLTVSGLLSDDPAQPVTFRLDGRLNGATVALSGTVLPFAAEPSFTLEVTAGGLDLAGLTPLLSGATLTGRGDLKAGAEGKIADGVPEIVGRGSLTTTRARLGGPLRIETERLGVEIAAVRWDGTRIEGHGSVSASGATLAGAGWSVGFGTLGLDLGRLAWAGGRFDADGKAEARRAELRTGELTLSAAALRLGAPSFSLAEGLTWRGDLALDQAQLRRPDLDLRPRSATWAGQVALDSTFAAGRAEGRLDLGATEIGVPGLAIAFAAARSEGSAILDPGTAQGITAQTKLSADRVRVTQSRPPGRLWAALDHVEADEASLGPKGEIGARTLSAQRLAALSRPGPAGYPARVEAATLRLDRPALAPDGGLSAGSARLGGLVARLTRLPGGLLGFSDPPAADDDGGPPPRLAIGRIEIADDSRLLFEDRVPPETVRLELERLAATLGAVDSARPERDSPFSVSAALGGATLTASGHARPFGRPPSGEIDARVTALELPPLSPYAAQALGLDLRTGHFDGQIKGRAAQGQLDGRLDLTLNNLSVAAPRPGSPLGQQVGMPIETVLDLLRDGDGRIRLGLPISGRIDRPDIDISDAVAQAVAGALKSTMVTTLRLAFPLSFLFDLATDDSGRVGLPPLAFPPGEATLTGPQRESLSRLAQLLRDRPGLHVSLCGVAGPADAPVLAERRRADRPLIRRLGRLLGGAEAADAEGAEEARAGLLSLADQRAAAVRAVLAEDEGIPAGRLFGCRAEIDGAEGAAGRVELTL